jgi:hypothetical protein
MQGATADLNVQGQNVPSAVSQPSASVGRAEFDADFEYRPLTPLAPLALFLGLASLASFMWVGALVLPITGVLIGLLALWRIRQSEGEVSGKTMAVIGLGLSAVLLLGGGGFHGYVYATEVPEGYERLSFNWLAAQSPVYEDGRLAPSPELKAVNGKKVYVKGYMYPTGQLTGLTQFTLCKDTGECCFGGQPKVTDMIQVTMKDGMTVNHRELILTGVAGTLRVRPKLDAGELVSLYTLEATHFR